ncbi:MAG: hypothetical protein AABW51_04555 [Nanoarchaeota archaeon]
MKNLAKKLAIGAMALGLGGFGASAAYNVSTVRSKKSEIEMKYKVYEVDQITKLINNYPSLQSFPEIKEYRDSLKSVKGFSEAVKQYGELGNDNNNLTVFSMFLMAMGIMGYPSRKNN